MKIPSERHQQTVVISLAGSFDALTADQARHTIVAQVEGGQQQVVLDLSQVSFMSSAGVRVILGILKQSRGLSGDLRLAAAQPGVRRILEISGLVRLPQVYPNAEEAVHSFGSQEP